MSPNEETVLSVREAAAYIAEHYGQNLTSERNVSRLLSEGSWPCTRTPAGHLGITVADLRMVWSV